MMSDRKDLLSSGNELLDRIDQVATEASLTTTKARVDRLLESACPAIGNRYTIVQHNDYAENETRDAVWDELFTLPQMIGCGCDDDDDDDECMAEEFNVDHMSLFFGYGSYTDVYATANNLDVLDDPELQPLHMPRTRGAFPGLSADGLFEPQVAWSMQEAPRPEITRVTMTLDELAPITEEQLRTLLGYDVGDEVQVTQVYDSLTFERQTPELGDDGRVTANIDNI